MKDGHALPEKILPFSRDEHLFGEEEVIWPVDNLFVRVRRILGAKWRVSDETFEEDGYVVADFRRWVGDLCKERTAEGPPVALLAVPFHQENLRSDLRNS
jgi:hypothetical protein